MRYTLHVLCLFILMGGLSPILAPNPAEAVIPEEPPPSPGTANNIANYDFKVSPGLRPQVDFWKKVFTQYGTYQILIHDKKYVSIVYEVLDLSYLKDKKLPYKKELRYRQARAAECKRKYTAILNRLAADPVLDPAKLAPEDRRVYDLFYGINDPDKFIHAAEDKRMRAQVGQRDRFIKGIYNWSKYRERMEEIFTEQGLPAQLTYLPFVESFFTTEAISCAKAVGMWQFMGYTGRLYLNINRVADERRDPYKATLAAAKLLRSNYERLGSWPLAITAYNHGANGIARGVERTGSTDLTDLIISYKQKLFGFASQNYYAEFLAVLEIVPNYKSCFGDIETAVPLQCDTFTLPKSMTIGALARYCNLTTDEIKGLNPGLTKNVTLSRVSIPKGYGVNIPHGAKDAAVIQQAKISNDKSLPDSQNASKPETGGEAISKAKAEESVQKQTDPVPVRGERHRVVRGETLQKIAYRYHTNVAVLKELNDLNGSRIKLGQQIYLPANSQVAQAEPPKKTAAPAANKTTESPQESKTVVSANSESSRKIEANIVAANFLAIGEPGRALLHLTQAKFDANEPMLNHAGLKVRGEGNIVKLTVAQEETIGLYADWCGISVSVIRQINKWKKSRPLTVGQTVKLDISQVGRDTFESRRLAFHKDIQQKYLSSYRVERVQTHTLGSRQNIWYLCQYVYKIPLWLLEMYNDGRDLTRLIPGDQLYIPIVTKL